MMVLSVNDFSLVGPMTYPVTSGTVGPTGTGTKE